MPNPNDPQLKAQKKALGQEIEQLEQQIEANPDDEGLEQQLEAKEGEMKALNDQLKQSRVAARDERKAGRTQGGQSGQAKANAPGQQKKQ